jgi:hypothetical protein
MLKEIFVLSLMLVIPLSANAQIVGDGTDNVIIHDYPFDITILEGGSFTLYNYNGTGSINIISYGWFEEHEALENNTVTVRLLPETIPGMYTVNDVNDDTIISTVTVVAPYVPEPSIDSLFVSNDVDNSYVRMIGTTPYQNEEITFVFYDSNLNMIDQYTHVTNYDGNYEAIWRILDYLPDGFYSVKLDNQMKVFEWKSIEQFNPIIPVDGIVVDEPIKSVTESSDIEVLDLRLRILQVIESIFKIILG